MKICGVICEYNPLHNGHAYLLEEARARSGCDAVVCVMSGCFTQRGEPALFGRYTRARHAVLAGADAVIELPVLFAAAPAEVFAAGAVRLLASLPDLSALAFGCERGSADDFFAAARAAKEENPAFRAALRSGLRSGMSFLKARGEALAHTSPQTAALLLRSPNNTLGVEYAKALLACGSTAALLPVRRRGCGHADTSLGGRFSSATSIRAAVREGRAADAAESVPPYVSACFQEAVSPALYRGAALYALLQGGPERLREIFDCGEGLENLLLSAARTYPDYERLVAATTSRRYTSSRIRRILLASALDIRTPLVRSALSEPLYIKPLAVKKEAARPLLAALARSAFPLIARRADEQKLCGTAAEVYAKDALAAALYAVTAGRAEADNLLLI